MSSIGISSLPSAISWASSVSTAARRADHAHGGPGSRLPTLAGDGGLAAAGRDVQLQPLVPYEGSGVEVRDCCLPANRVANGAARDDLADMERANVERLTRMQRQRDCHGSDRDEAHFESVVVVSPNALYAWPIAGRESREPARSRRFYARRRGRQFGESLDGLRLPKLERA